jgi:superfamily I DNA/RNA helicase
MSHEKYTKAKADRDKHAAAIIASASRKKLVVAGPGTGKTHLFKRVLTGKKKTVTLSFVNSLVADLALELCGLSEVRTLHGYALGAMSEVLGEGVKIHPDLSGIVEADAKIVLGKDINFDEIFHKRDDANEHIKFYKERKNYYKHYGYADIVFAVARYFEAHNDKIPTYDQVVVDEFQDFNALEVSLIDLLSRTSPVLLAGDDDQALYDFKHASAAHIRQRHADKAHGYEAFNLPFCSRCTRVIVEATNDIIAAAKANGNLVGRIGKPYIYFDDEDKDKESAQYPQIVHSRMQAAQIPWYINNEMAKIAEDLKRSFTVLVISPTKVQSRTIVKGLRLKGLKNIDFADRKDGGGPTLLDGLKLMLEPKQSFSNLGWRIAAQHVLTEEELAGVVRESAKDNKKPIHELFPKPAKKQVTKSLKTLRALQKEKDVKKEDVDELLERTGIDARSMAVSRLQEEVFDEAHSGHASIRTIPIKATTIQGSKGLAADYVFITHFDDTYFIRDKDKTKVSDQDVCSFLVALTRAKKKAYLISSNPKANPKFRAWIKDERIEDFAFGEEE